MKSQSQTDSEILESAKLETPIMEADGISTLRIRKTESVHSHDCSCNICLPLRYTPFSSLAETKRKTDLDYFNE